MGDLAQGVEVEGDIAGEPVEVLPRNVHDFRRRALGCRFVHRALPGVGPYTAPAACARATTSAAVSTSNAAAHFLVSSTSTRTRVIPWGSSLGPTTSTRYRAMFSAVGLNGTHATEAHRVLDASPSTARIMASMMRSEDHARNRWSQFSSSQAHRVLLMTPKSTTRPTWSNSAARQWKWTR